MQQASNDYFIIKGLQQLSNRYWMDKVGLARELAFLTRMLGSCKFKGLLNRILVPFDIAANLLEKWGKGDVWRVKVFRTAQVALLAYLKRWVPRIIGKAQKSNLECRRRGCCRENPKTIAIIVDAVVAIILLIGTVLI
jgi:hypothetical protein